MYNTGTNQSSLKSFLQLPTNAPLREQGTVILTKLAGLFTSKEASTR